MNRRSLTQKFFSLLLVTLICSTTQAAFGPIWVAQAIAAVFTAAHEGSKPEAKGLQLEMELVFNEINDMDEWEYWTERYHKESNPKMTNGEYADFYPEMMSTLDRFVENVVKDSISDKDFQTLFGSQTTRDGNINWPYYIQAVKTAQEWYKIWRWQPKENWPMKDHG